MNRRTPFYFVALLFLVFACDSVPPLGYYGNHYVNEETGETVYNSIRDFSFVDQDSQVVTNDYFADGVYIADFFFTSCPTICPITKRQMLRILEKYKGDERVKLLSHTMDIKRDTVGRLKQYAQGIEADSPQWRFVTGNRDSIFSISYDYMSTVLDAPDAPGGFDHSGYLLLIDRNRHIRAYVDGTKPEKVDVFMQQIDLLLEEEFGGEE
ncbi:MAG: SCO family protein [Bacteroidota bacterium]